MCLTTKDKKERVAKRDMNCYKVVRECTTGVKSPIVDHVFSDKTKITGMVVNAEGRKTTEMCGGTLTEVSNGYIHSFKRLKDALAFAKSIQPAMVNEVHGRMVVYKCTIPKGTSYYSGFTPLTLVYSYADLYAHSNERNSYASDKIKFEEKYDRNS